MGAHVRTSATRAVLVVCFFLLATTVLADDPALKPPQLVTLQFTTGRKYRGTLLSVDENKVKFRLKEGTAPAVYDVDQIKSIQTDKHT